jgi:hypothetical protein
LEIAKLPQDQRDKLEPLLHAMELAADDPEGLVAAKLALELAINAIGGSTRDALAPYFDDIDPTDPLRDIENQLRSGFGDVVSAINAARGIGGIGSVGDGVPSYAVGTAFVPRDMLANIHQGEMVIDAATAGGLRQYGINVRSTGAADTDVSDAIRKLGDRMESRLGAVEAAVRSGAHMTAGAVTESIGDLALATDFNTARSAARRTL